MSNHMKVAIRDYRAMQEKVKSLERDNTELNQQLMVAVGKYIEAASEAEALRRECARRS